MTGTIKKLVKERGFGFISPTENTGKDLFFHSEDLVGIEYTTLNEGDAVTFESGESEKGPKAVNIQRA